MWRLLPEHHTIHLFDKGREDITVISFWKLCTVNFSVSCACCSKLDLIACAKCSSSFVSRINRVGLSKGSEERDLNLYVNKLCKNLIKTYNFKSINTRKCCLIEQNCIHIRDQGILIDYRDLIRFSFFFQNENLLYGLIS